ncbi:MAG: hypothetical protein AB7N65_02940 [Vicinamibacterales bacterium]
MASRSASRTAAGAPCLSTLGDGSRLDGAARLSIREVVREPLPRAKVVTLTYGRLVLADFPLDVDMRYVPRLDRARLPPGTVDRTFVTPAGGATSCMTHARVWRREVADGPALVSCP